MNRAGQISNWAWYRPVLADRSQENHVCTLNTLLCLCNEVKLAAMTTTPISNSYGQTVRHTQWDRPWTRGKQSCDTLAVTPPESPALLAVGAGQMGWAFLAFNSFSSLLLSFPWRDWTCPLYTRWAVVRYPLFKCHSLQSWVSHLQCSSPVPPNNLACFFFYCWLLVRDTDLQQTVITEVITRYIICF